MTISCQSADDPATCTILGITVPCTPGGVILPTSLTAQSMTITPSNMPCYDPCTVYVQVTWVNNTIADIPPGQTVGITRDGSPAGTATTTGPVTIGSTVTYTFTVTGLVHTATNIICPTPN